MAWIKLQEVSVDFPIYNAKTRSIKNRVMAAGGRITKSDNNRVIVEAHRDVSICIEHGEKVGLVGHNGAGKTTLLRVLGGVYEPARGKVLSSGVVAGLFDTAVGLDAESTGYENIYIRGLLLGMEPREIKTRMNEIAEFTELGDYLSMPLRTYSAGMVLRLAFAVSTCIQPDILLLDEWMSVGDAEFMQKAKTRMGNFVKNAGVLVLASHSKSLIRKMCTKVVWLERGRIRLVGETQQILDQYFAAERETNHFELNKNGVHGGGLEKLRANALPTYI